MALLTFPTNPVNLELFPVTPVAGQQQYQFEAATSTWRLLGTATTVATGTYGDASNVGQFTVDAQGRLTSATNVPITLPTNLTFVPAPASSVSPGLAGEVAVSGTYLYIYTGAQWQRVAWDVTPW